MYRTGDLKISMDEAIIISNLNDFVFCPASIYFHKLYGSMDNILFQTDYQLNGTKTHEAVDNQNYSSKKSIITGMSVYCEKYNLIGKIDIYDAEKKLLVERKKHINEIYDGYIFQIYAQYFAMTEMGYKVEHLEFYSADDNKKYRIDLPSNNPNMLGKFENVIAQMKTINLETYKQDNPKKCENCIYEPACDRAANR